MVREGAREPVRRGVMSHFNFALGLARRNPIVFVPILLYNAAMSVLGELTDYLGLGDILDRLYSFLWQYEEFSYVSYASYQPVIEMPPDLERLVFIGVAIGLVYITFSMLNHVTSIHVSREAYLKREINLTASYTYALGRLLTFVATSMLGVLGAFGIMMVPFIGLLFLSGEVGASITLILLLAALGVVASFIFVWQTTYFLMVLNDSGMLASFNSSVSFFRERWTTIVGLGLLGTVLGLSLMLIPVVGGFLSILPEVVINIAIIDLYYQYRGRIPQ